MGDASRRFRVTGGNVQVFLGEVGAGVGNGVKGGNVQTGRGVGGGVG